MSEEITNSAPKTMGGAAKKYCFLCAMARYLTAFVLGVVAGLIWGAF